MPAPRSDPFQLSLEPGPDDDITTATTIRRDRPSLLDQLSIIDAEGWDGPAGTRLLQYLRTELVRPLTIHLGLRGAAASQAEATAWEAVWLEATNPSLRAADSPWGVLWRTARRAVLNEVVATRFASSPRQGWILAAAARRGQEHPPISLEALVAEGWETPSNDLDADVALILADVFAEASEALVQVGWDAVAAERVVTALANLEPPRDARSVALGWRSLATAPDTPPPKPTGPRWSPPATPIPATPAHPWARSPSGTPADQPDTSPSSSKPTPGVTPTRRCSPSTRSSTPPPATTAGST